MFLLRLRQLLTLYTCSWVSLNFDKSHCFPVEGPSQSSVFRVSHNSNHLETYNSDSKILDCDLKHLFFPSGTRAQFKLWLSQLFPPICSCLVHWSSSSWTSWINGTYPCVCWVILVSSTWLSVQGLYWFYLANMIWGLSVWVFFFLWDGLISAMPRVPTWRIKLPTFVWQLSWHLFSMGGCTSS
jgi:hypothetical protein